MDHVTKRYVPGEAAMWVFIFGDMVMFSMFFDQFIYDRAHQLALFAESQRSLSIFYGAINTIVLLTGSLFVVLGVEATKKSPTKSGSVARCFALTMICAVIFVIDKVFEYADHLRSGVTPATNAFFMYYYLFTGIHALHLVIGIAFLVRMLQLSRNPVQSVLDIRFIESGASFWHLVDLLWIALFAILYLLP